jgi:hypothetical protein
MPQSSSERKRKSKAYYQENKAKIAAKARSKRRRSPCPVDYVRNSSTGRCVLKSAVKLRQKSAKKRVALGQRMILPCPMGKRRSPKGRCVMTTSSRRRRVSARRRGVMRMK